MGNVGLDPHLLYTLSAVQNLIILGQLDRIDKDAVANCFVWCVDGIRGGVVAVGGWVFYWG